MKKLTGILSTTHVDRHNDRMALSALESMRENIATQWIPLGVEHDPRIAPIGRVTTARVVELPDGEHGLEGEAELFEPGDELPLQDDSRQIPIKSFDTPDLYISSDRGFSQPDEQRLVREIAALFGTEPEQDCKKALEPIAVLTIAGAFVLGQIATGFFGRLGEDGYDALKSKLKALFGPRPRNPDSLLQLTLVVRRQGYEVEVDVISTNPSAEDIGALLEQHLRTLDEQLPSLLDAGAGIKKLVFEVRTGKLDFRFAVRRDAVPVFLATGGTPRDDA